MLRGQAAVVAGSLRIDLALTELECASVVVFRNGYDDIDVEDTGNGFALTATGPAGEVVANGKTMEDACERLVQKVVKHG